MLTGCYNPGQYYERPIYDIGPYYWDKLKNKQYNKRVINGEHWIYDGNTPIAKWDNNKKAYVSPGNPPTHYKPQPQDFDVEEHGFLGYVAAIGDGMIIGIIANDASAAKNQLDAFSSFVSADQDLEYDAEVADLLASAFDFTSVSTFWDFESQCAYSKSLLDQLTPPQTCSTFQGQLAFLLGDPLYVINPDYAWTNNSFTYAQNGDELTMAAVLGGVQLFNVTLERDGSGEVTLTGTVKGMSVTTAMQSHPILIYQPFINEAFEWGYERDAP